MAEEIVMMSPAVTFRAAALEEYTLMDSEVAGSLSGVNERIQKALVRYLAVTKPWMLVTFWPLKGLRKVLPLMEEMLMADVRGADAATV